MDKFVKECFVKNVHHFDALKIWQFLQIGHKVSLEIDEENKKEIRICISFKKTEYLFVRNRNIITDIEKDFDKAISYVSLCRLIEEDPIEGFTIGNISEEDSTSMIDVISCNHENVYYGRISAIDEKNEENKRIKVAIYIKDNNKKD